MKKGVLIISVIFLLLASFMIIGAGCNKNSDNKSNDTNDSNNGNEVIGGQRDEHGCLGPAGYSYNETVGACLREWEVEETHRSDVKTAVNYLKKVTSVIGLTVIEINSTENGKNITFDQESRKIIVYLNFGNVTNAKFYCSEDSRHATVCPSLIEPICGYDSSETKLTEHFSNSCTACLNENLEFYTMGDCN